jgi:hypothetical protein
MKNININLADVRQTVINWPMQVKAIVDGYLSFNTLAHGVQKDAIQNSWDARLDKKSGYNWKLEFELIENEDQSFFLFTDFGTTGLTGRILKEEELENDLPVEERWGRFENVAFTKDPAENALGARGRGKFIFVGASKHQARTKDYKIIKNLILYDSLREDNIYRFGFRTLITTHSPIQAYEKDDAIIKLNEFTKGVLSPLSKVGTRVIIVDPVIELIDEIKVGKFLEHIEETWWEIIKNFNVKISLKINGHLKYARRNSLCELPVTDSKNNSVWLRENIKLPQAPNYKIEKIHIVYCANKKVSENLRGIAIQRGGMKVTSIDIKYLDKSIADSIYGYIKLDADLEKEMQKYEGIEHYSYDFKKMIPRLLKQFIDDECEEFIRQKLGIETNKKNRIYEKEKSAEIKALYQVNQIAKQLGLTGIGKSKSNGGGEPRTDFPVRLSFGQFEFPSDNARVNYGESIKKIRLIVYNDKNVRLKLGIRFSILFEDGEETLIYLENYQKEVRAKSSLTIISDQMQPVDKDIFPNKGKYTFHAKLVSLEENERGQILHKLSKNFWVEENPPQKGIFDDIESIDYPKELKEVLGEAAPSGSKSYKFYYNRLHPAKVAIDNDEDKLMKYLVEIMCIELAWIDLRNIEQKIFNKADLNNHPNLLRSFTKFLGSIRYKLNS